MTQDIDSEPSEGPDNPIIIGISSCLLGEPVRFDGGHKLHSYVTKTLGQYFQWRAFCPEMAIGLGTPRETLRLVDSDDGVRCVGNKTAELDVTEQLAEVADAQRGWHSDLCGYILKKDSPSCGMERVKVYRSTKPGTVPEKKGAGIYAAALQRNFPSLPVEEEGRLGDPVLRENFIQRVFAYRHWRDVGQSGWSQHKLTDFHSQYKYVLLSRDQQQARDLGKRLAEMGQDYGEDTAAWYFDQFMHIMAIRASRKNHVNVLQHLQGFVKNDIDKDDRKELTETVDSYRLGLVPLIVPIVLLRHHFRRHPKPFTSRSRYLDPYPAELMLLNSI